MDIARVSDDLQQVLVTSDDLRRRVSELAAEIDAHYQGREVLLIGVLKGAVMFMADLSRAMQNRLQMDWMAVSSYGSGTMSSGVVRILKDLDADVLGREVLIVEDIIDSGLTLSWLVSNLETRGAKDIRVVTMLRKPSAAKVEVDVHWVGFDIPNDFVVGYGLDWDEKYRSLDGVAVLKPSVYGK